MKIDYIVDCHQLHPFFNNLVDDPYTLVGYRKRRFGTVNLNNTGFSTTITISETNTFIQDSDINKSEYGGVLRKFELLEPTLLTTNVFINIIKTFTEYTGITENIDIHQIRITPVENGTTAAPEGRHQDGYDYIGIFIINKENLSGGKVIIWNNIDDEEPIFQDELLNQYIIFDDREYFHTGTDLNIIDESQLALWDFFVVGGCK